MKKVVRIILAILMITCACLALTACKSDCDKGNHTWDSGVITKQPTCAEEGVRTFKCTVCDHEDAVKTEAVPATGNHTPKDISVQPTCTTAGTTGQTQCTVCNAPIAAGTAVEALGHNFDESKGATVVSTVKVNCTTDGSKVVKCSRCEETKTVKTAEKLGHDYQENNWTTGDGKHWHECRRAACEAKIDEGEHTYDSADALRCNVCRNPKEGINFVLSYGEADNLEEKAFNTLVEAIAFATNDVKIGTPVLIEMGTIDGNTTRESTGIKIGKDKNGSDVTGLNITINFKGKNYQVSRDLVGSAGTETNGFQILKGNTVKLMNGTVSVKAGTPAYVLIQNYADLTLDNIVIDGTNLAERSNNNSSYTLSNNFGNVTLTNATHIIAAEGENRVALDVWYNMGNWYADGVSVTVGPKSTITGIIEYGSAQANVADLAAKATLVLPELTAGEYKIRFSANITDCEATGITIGGVKFSHKEHTVEAVAPDCTNTGLTAGVDCSLCGKTIKAQQVVNALGHDFDMSIEGNCSDRVDSTCSQKGHVTVKCSRCDATEVQDLPFAEHTPGTESGKNLEGHYTICTVCGGAAGDVTPHTYVASICSVCEYEISDTDTVDALFALLKDQSLSGTYKLTGVLKEVGEYSEQYGNIEAVMTVDGRDIIVFRMKKGTSPVELGTLAVGDKITVVGTLKDYGGEKEFDAGCTLENVVRGTSTISCNTVENATVSEIPATLENGSTLTFTVTPNEKYIIEFVKANGAKIEAQDGQYSVIVRGNIEIEISIVLEGTTVDKDVKIDFSTKDQRLSLDNNSQVWANDGVTFTNNKDKSTTNVADYSNPIRLYKSSNVVIDATGIKSITINCNTASYAAALKASTFSAGTVTINDKVVTITFDEPVDSLTISALSAQVRIDSIVVTIAG